MDRNLQLMKVFSVIFKVISVLCLAFLGIGLVGLAVGGKPDDVSSQQFFQVLLNMILQGLVAAMVFFSFGEIIRILLLVEERSRRIL